MVRSSALASLSQYPAEMHDEVSIRSLVDPDPQVRAAAARNLNHRPSVLEGLLGDPVRFVRIEAALGLADLPASRLRTATRRARLNSLKEYRQSLLANADQPSAHMALGILSERLGEISAAENAYQRAIRVAPTISGPRANLAALLERRGKNEEASQLRKEEHRLLTRDVGLAPRSAAVQNRYGLSAYLLGQMDEAERALKTAYELEPNAPDFCLGLALFYQKLGRRSEALELTERLVNLRPRNPEYCMLLLQIYQDLERWNDAIQVVRHIETLRPGDRQLQQLRGFLEQQADRASTTGPQPR